MEPVPTLDSTDRGASLIEVLVSIVLLGVAGIAVLTALAATTVGARTHREVADTEAALASVGDALTAPGSSWWPCTTSDLASRYQDEIDDQFDGAIEVTVAEVQYWNGSTYGATCASTSGHRLQQLTLVATIGDEAPHTATVVKRPPVSVIPTAGTVPIDDEWESTIDWNQGGTGTTTTTTSQPTTTTTVAGNTTTSTSTTSTSTTSTSTTSTSTTSTSTTSTSTTVAPSGSLTCAFRVTQTWGSGGNGTLEITNGTGAAISSWRVRITLGSHGLDLWNANESISHGSLTATDVSWNASVAAGATTAVTGGSISGSSITLQTTLPCQVLSS